MDAMAPTSDLLGPMPTYDSLTAMECRAAAMNCPVTARIFQVRFTTPDWLFLSV